MPTAVGIWQVRYHAAGRYDTLATSADLPVNVSQFSASATKAAPGAPMTISWTAPAGRPTGYADVVGLDAVGAQNGQPSDAIVLLFGRNLGLLLGFGQPSQHPDTELCGH